MSRLLHSRSTFAVLFASVSFFAAACAQRFGPSYAIESQTIRVSFDPSAGPAIHIESEYKLRNDGTRALASLAIRVPARRRFYVAASQAAWDGNALAARASDANPRESILNLPVAWRVNETHSLRFSADFISPPAGEPGLHFSADAFFLPSEGWAPLLLPAEGFLGSGGVPPQRWTLSVTVPGEFLIHAGGRTSKNSRNGPVTTWTFAQGPPDRYPFVVAGRYRESRLDAGSQKVSLWTRASVDTVAFQQSADAFARVVKTYDATFGARATNAQALWIVECPATDGCLTAAESAYASLLGTERGRASSALASPDTLMIDFSAGPLRLGAAAPGLAASWLGYGQSPGFYDRQPPLSALPAFASALGEEAIEGPPAREETIRRALRVIPGNLPARKPESPVVLRAKSLLFFYALEDRAGHEVFRRAIDHVLSARRGRDLSIDDLISAFDQETQQNTAAFVRLWMKHPGVPDEFRARYETSSASLASNSKENFP